MKLGRSIKDWSTCEMLVTGTGVMAGETVIFNMY